MSVRTTVGGLQALLASMSRSAAIKPPVIFRAQFSRGYTTLPGQGLPLTRPMLLSKPFPSIGTVPRRFFAKKKKKGEHTEKEGLFDARESAQHSEWVEFQKAIAVEGVETGQTMVATKKKKKFEKTQADIRREERIEMRQSLDKMGAVAEQFSPEDTERLLKRAYAAIPPRDGKRGTRNLKRQKRRWWNVREIRKKYKKNMIRFHERRMAERSRKVKAVKSILKEAPDIVLANREYQLQVLKRWTETMKPKTFALGKGKLINVDIVSN